MPSLPRVKNWEYLTWKVEDGVAQLVSNNFATGDGYQLVMEESAAPARTTPLLEASDLVVGYGPVSVLQDVNLIVRPGEIVALLGPNGSGKTTTLLALAGELRLMSGAVKLFGRPAQPGLHRRARAGLRLITEDRSVFMGLTVYDNLRLGQKNIDPCLEIFPQLRPLLRRKVGVLSGGEQQMLTLARALSSGASLLLADELSLGLAARRCRSAAGCSEERSRRRYRGAAGRAAHPQCTGRR